MNDMDAETLAIFKDGKGDEQRLFQSIREHLLTPEQKKIIEENNASVEMMIKGECEGDAYWCEVIFDQWNQKLGFHCFGNPFLLG